MRPLLRKFVRSLLDDEMAVRRWGRGLLGGLGAGGVAFAQELSANGVSPEWVARIKIASAAAVLVALLINLGERNERPEPPAAS
jgi:hypothetical protein